MKYLIDRLRSDHVLPPEAYKKLLSHCDDATLSYANEQAREVSVCQFGKEIYIRGLIEISNRCKNDCYYCGIRRSNPNISRYRLSRRQILECCRQGYRLGFRTFVLQGGEDPAHTDDWVESLVSAIRSEFPDCAVTLSLGEKSSDAYERFYRAGADRYLLRHETYDEAHYRRLHPAAMSRTNRLRCLDDLKAAGYQVGTGIMAGSPGQTIDHLVSDLIFIQQFRPEMIGIGPFLSHKDTPFATAPAGSLQLTLLLLSLSRLMFPAALIPATTSLGTLVPGGREMGILAGANVVMPNLSPLETRADYSLYDHKICTGEEAAEGLEALRAAMQRIGYRLSGERGDYAGLKTVDYVPG